MSDKTLEAKDIEALLPHRYPFLLVDRVLDWEKDRSIKAVKNVTVNEPQFQGHFPGFPIMPGVLVVEALAQACGVLVKLSVGDKKIDDSKMYLVGITKARFKRQVLPGDTLVLEAESVRSHRNMAQMSCKATVDGELACSAELMMALEI